MMKIEQRIISAIANKDSVQLSKRDRVEYDIAEQVSTYRLHNSAIFKVYYAHSSPSTWASIVISNCGYYTNTTKSRLNALLAHYSLPYIYQKDYQWYFSDGIEGNIPYTNGHGQRHFSRLFR